MSSSRFPLGTYRGLSFGIVLHPIGAPEAYLEGAVTRHAHLSRDAHGPRAILNALDRLLGSYEGQAATAAQDLDIARTQLRDHEARLGKPFAHEAYLAELTTARDSLRAALSDTPPEPGADPLPSAAELAERIKQLKAAHSIDAAPARPAGRTTTAAETPVTARIRRLADAQVLEPEASPDVPQPSVEPFSSPCDATDAEPFVLTLAAAPARRKPDYRDRVASKPRQLSLF